MARGARWMWSVALLALVGSLLPFRALAATDEPSSHALKLAYEGDDLYAQGRWSDAYERFAAAEGIQHSPVFVLYMARCRKNAGHFLEAQQLYARVVREPIRPDAPKPFQDAIAKATDEAKELLARTPALSILVTGGPGAVVRVDGRDVPDPHGDIPLDPGPHTLEVSSGSRSVHRDVDLRDGAGTMRVELSLSPLPPRLPPKRGSAAPTIIGLSLGAAALAVGVTTGIVAAEKTSALEPDCPDNHCLVTDASRLDSARAFATISTIGFVAAGVGLAAGVVLWFTRSTTPGAPGPTSPGPTSGVFLGPTQAGFAGSF
jgi:hypothetical protein